MRWPFFFGRASAKGSPGPAPRAPLREWAWLPAIQRAVGEPRLTAPTADFVNSLAGTQDPDLSLEPLGHHVALDAPAGLVAGLASNVETYAASSELVGRPRPRRDTPVQRRLFSSEDATAPPSTVVDAETALVNETVITAFPVIDEPVPVRAPLTRMAEPDANAVMRLAMPRPAPVAPAAQPEPAGSDAAQPQPPRRTVTAQRLSLGQSRRLGLGAPLSPQRATAVQRAAEAPALDLAPPARAPRAEGVEGPPAFEAHAAGAEIDENVMAAAERIAPLAGAPVQREPAGRGPGFAPESELLLARPARAAVPEHAAAPAPGAPIQPVVARPLPPLYARPASTPTAPIAGDRAPLSILRRAAGSVETATGAVESQSVQRSAAAHVAVETLLAQHDTVRHAMVVPAAAVEAVTAHAVGPRSLPALAPLAPSAAAVQRVTPAAQDFVAYSSFALQPAAHSAQRATTLADVPAQREIAAGEAPATEPSATSAPIATAAAAGAEAATALSGQSDKDLDELARKLHDRISLNLRRELLIQRERAGLVTDWR